MTRKICQSCGVEFNVKTPAQALFNWISWIIPGAGILFMAGGAVVGLATGMLWLAALCGITFVWAVVAVVNDEKHKAKSQIGQICPSCRSSKTCNVDSPLGQETKQLFTRKAAEQGNAYAQSALGCCYEKGEGVEPDHHEAIEWYRKAAVQGVVEAKEALTRIT